LKKILTCIADTESSDTTAVSATHRLSRTRNSDQFVEDNRYFHTVYADELHRDVESPYGFINSLDVGLSDAPVAGLDEVTQHSCSNETWSISELYKTKDRQILDKGKGKGSV